MWFAIDHIYLTSIMLVKLVGDKNLALCYAQRLLSTVLAAGQISYILLQSTMLALKVMCGTII